VIDLCHLDAARQSRIVGQVARLADQGWRVLGVARAVFAADRLPPIQHDFDFEFVGLVALEDPLRPEVPAAIAECRAAGIRVVMMTGDHPSTAVSVARQAGLDVAGGVVPGTALAALDDAGWQAQAARSSVFCRVQPEQKLRLVQALQARGEVVAMTGDGVNDAPALRAAHIGVAMGARGTDVAREAADLVLMQDSLAGLVTAVRHGRRVFANLRKAMVFVLAAHVPIIGLTFLPVLLGWPMLLMPVHVLCLQLVIDPACSLVFEAQPAEPGLMQAPPGRGRCGCSIAVCCCAAWGRAGLGAGVSGRLCRGLGAGRAGRVRSGAELWPAGAGQRGPDLRQPALGGGGLAHPGTRRHGLAGPGRGPAGGGGLVGAAAAAGLCLRTPRCPGRRGRPAAAGAGGGLVRMGQAAHALTCIQPRIRENPCRLSGLQRRCDEGTLPRGNRWRMTGRSSHADTRSRQAYNSLASGHAKVFPRNFQA
jgi:soluble P-type ATPase